MISNSGNDILYTLDVTEKNTSVTLPPPQKTHAVCPICPSRYFAEFDHESTRFSRFISSTFGNISLSQALEEIVSIPVDKLLMIYDLTAGYFYECKGCFDAYQSLLPMFSNFYLFIFWCRKTTLCHGKGRSRMPCYRTSHGMLSAMTFTFLRTRL